MSDEERFKEQIKLFLPEYKVRFEKGGDDIEEFRGQAAIEAVRERVSDPVWDAIGMILVSFDNRIRRSFPKATVLYVFPPDEWKGCTQEQRVWGPSRFFVEKDHFDMRLCMGIMIGAEKESNICQTTH